MRIPRIWASLFRLRRPRIKKLGVADVASHFKGKTIQVRGCVMRFEERPYLLVHDPGQIVVIEKL